MDTITTNNVGCYENCSFCKKKAKTCIPCKFCNQAINPEHKLYFGKSPAPSWVKGNLDDQIIWSHVDCYVKGINSKSTYFVVPPEYINTPA